MTVCEIERQYFLLNVGIFVFKPRSKYILLIAFCELRPKSFVSNFWDAVQSFDNTKKDVPALTHPLNYCNLELFGACCGLLSILCYRSLGLGSFSCLLA